MNEIPFIVVSGYPRRPTGLCFGVLDKATGFYVMEDGDALSVKALQEMGCAVFGLTIVPLP